MSLYSKIGNQSMKKFGIDCWNCLGAGIKRKTELTYWVSKHDPSKISNQTVKCSVCKGTGKIRKRVIEW